MLPIKPGINTPQGWWDLDVKEDITPVEAVHLNVILTAFTVFNRGLDFWGYAKEHGITRHFKQLQPEDATIKSQSVPEVTG